MTLIERLESATEGSRELDEAIINALCPDAMCRQDPAWEDSITVYHADALLDSGKAELPHYTTSLDAALTLVPEGWEWSLAGGNKNEPVQVPYASCWPDEQPFPAELDLYAEAATPSLALCIAALKAREAMSND